MLLMCIRIIAQDTELKIDNEVITMPLNKEIRISADVEDGMLHNFKILNHAKVHKPIDMMKILDDVEKIDIKSNEIELKFCYANVLESQFVVLTVLHHLEKPIVFKAKIQLKGRKDYIETTIITKHPNVLSIEQWKDEIESIILFDFKTIAEQN